MRPGTKRLPPTGSSSQFRPRNGLPSPSPSLRCQIRRISRWTSFQESPATSARLRSLI
jgi:hypothetical protein